jgi:hypothetical protein
MSIALGILLVLVFAGFMLMAGASLLDSEWPESLIESQEPGFTPNEHEDGV